MNKSEMIEELESRVLVMAPTARDVKLSRRILAEAGLEGLVCQNLETLCAEVRAGAGAVVLIEKAIVGDQVRALAELLREQPAWSDLPIILMARGVFASQSAAALEVLGNVVLLARPVRLATLVSTVRTALRARARQYQMRRQLAEREQQEKALARSEERLRLATSVAGIGIWQWDLLSDRQEWDGQCKALFGLSPEAEVSFQRWRDLLHPEDRPRLLAAVPRFIEEGEEQKEEYRVLLPDGTVRWLLVRGAITRDAAGRPLQMVGIAMDITERRMMEEVLRRAKEAADAANRAKSEFLANMSHEIRTPLTVTMGTIELLQGTALSEEQRHYLEMAQSASENLLRLIEDLLDFSRLEAGRMAFRQEPFDLGTCVQTAVQAFGPEVQRKGLRLALEIDPGVPGIVVGDADRLRQVLFNLVDNAIKFTERGEVTVMVCPDPETPLNLVFTVRDTGIGIPVEKMDLLFQAFSQLDSSHTRRYGGTGLGLILSKRLLARMGGSIRVESTPGKGSHFSFSLPLLPKTETQLSPIGTHEAPASPVSASSACRILLAEDDPPVRELIEMILHRRNWQVVAANDGQEALAAWEADSFDLILMDVQMPELGGLEAARLIREKERERGGHIPIIALTAHARQEDRNLCRQAGMDDFLSKPVQMANLYAMVERYLGEEGRD